MFRMELNSSQTQVLVRLSLGMSLVLIFYISSYPWGQETANVLLLHVRSNTGSTALS